MIKAYIHYIACYNKSNLWFVRLFEMKLDYENHIMDKLRCDNVRRHCYPEKGIKKHSNRHIF